MKLSILYNVIIFFKLARGFDSRRNPDSGGGGITVQVVTPTEGKGEKRSKLLDEV